PRQPSERTPPTRPIARIASETASGIAVAPRTRGEAEGVIAVFGIPDLASEAPAERAVVVHVGVGAHGERLTEERTRETARARERDGRARGVHDTAEGRRRAEADAARAGDVDHELVW